MGLTQRLGTIPLAIQTDSSNNVGIGGAANASYKLAVTGNTLGTGTAFDFFTSSGIGSSGVTGLLRVVTAGTSSAIAVGQANSSRYTAIQANEHIIYNDDFFMRTNGAFPLSLGTNNTIRMTITSAGNVGIGTSSPWGKFNVVDGTNKSFVVQDAGMADTIELTNYTNSGGLRQMLISSSNILFYTGTAGGGSATERMRITSGGDVNIGAVVSAGNRLFVRGSSTSSGDTTIFAQNSAGTNLFFVRNNGTFYTGTAAESPYNLTIAASANVFVFSDGALFRATSSARYKKDIEDVNVDTFGLINKIRPVWYRSTTGNDRDDWSWYGFIAEELAEVDPRFVHFGYAPEDYIKDEETGKTELKEDAELRADGVMYDRLTVLLIKGMQEQQKQIQELSAKVTALESQS